MEVTLNDMPSWTDKDKFSEFFEANPELRMELLLHHANLHFISAWQLLEGEAEKQLGISGGHHDPGFLRIHAAVWGTMKAIRIHREQGQHFIWSEVQEILKDPSFVEERDEVFEKWKSGTAPFPMLAILGMLLCY